TLLAHKGVPSVVWQFLPENGLRILGPEYVPLNTLVEKHPGEFMVKVYPDAVPSRDFDWLIVPRPGSVLAPPDKPSQDPDGGPGPVHAKPPTAPPRPETTAQPE